MTATTHKKSFSFGLQPAAAWTAILGLWLFSALLILVGAGKILNLAFPLGSFAVGAFLYFRYPILYIGFSWWMLFLTPLLRRLADFRSGFTDPSPMLLAPYLVTGLTFITCWQHFPKAYRQGGLPFVLSFVGVIYALLIGLINRQPSVVLRAFLDWLPPVSFGFHLWVNWANYPSYRQNIQRIFLWGVLVMGVYGIVQFVIAPEWDLLWMNNTPIASSNGGKPGPFALRIWSTTTSTEPFAGMMAAGLLLLSTQKGILNLSASVAGYLSLILTMVRSAWLGWFVGFLTLASSLKAKHQMRLIIIVLVMAVLVVPLTTIEPFSEKINERLTSFSNVEKDESTQVRKETFNSLIGHALTNFVGDGIGGESIDSALLSLLIDFGWLGTIFYMSGMLMLVFAMFQGSEVSFDPFIGAVRAIVISVLIRLPVNNSILGISGLVLWVFLGMGMAAKKYYQHQRNLQLSQSLPQNLP